MTYILPVERDCEESETFVIGSSTKDVGEMLGLLASCFHSGETLLTQLVVYIQTPW